MYSADLTKISIDRFDETLRTIELLPSRRVLQDHISTVTSRLKERGIEDLGALRRLLADKQRYTPLGEELGVDAEYLVLLNREVNAYRSKPLPLSKLDVFSDAELDGLAEVGIRSTKHLYERAALPAQRTALVAELKLDGEHMVAALQLSNLVRVNGVGPAFAHFLRNLGVFGPEDVIAMSTEEIVDRYNQSIADRPGQPALRVEDVDHCRRFARVLTSDIE